MGAVAARRNRSSRGRTGPARAPGGVLPLLHHAGIPQGREADRRRFPGLVLQPQQAAIPERRNPKHHVLRSFHAGPRRRACRAVRDVPGLCRKTDQDAGHERLEDRPLPVHDLPVTSDWKIVDGQWFWYIDPEELRHTPFGVIQERTNVPSTPGSLPTSIPTTADFAMNLVKAETRSVKLKPGESAQVAFSNGARGLVNLSIERLTRPRAPLLKATCADSPGFSFTDRVSAFTRFIAKSAVVGIDVGSEPGVDGTFVRS